MRIGANFAAVLLGLSFAAVEVAPAALVATFLTSIAGAGMRLLLKLSRH